MALQKETLKSKLFLVEETISLNSFLLCTKLDPQPPPQPWSGAGEVTEEEEDASLVDQVPSFFHNKERKMNQTSLSDTATVETCTLAVGPSSAPWWEGPCPAVN